MTLEIIEVKNSFEEWNYLLSSKKC